MTPGPGDLIIIKRFELEDGTIFQNNAIGMILGDHLQDMRDLGIIKVLVEGRVVEIYENRAEPIDATG